MLCRLVLGQDTRQASKNGLKLDLDNLTNNDIFAPRIHFELFHFNLDLNDYIIKLLCKEVECTYQQPLWKISHYCAQGPRGLTYILAFI